MDLNKSQTVHISNFLEVSPFMSFEKQAHSN